MHVAALIEGSSGKPSRPPARPNHLGVALEN
jgi:hypothetical protein